MSKRLTLTDETWSADLWRYTLTQKIITMSKDKLTVSIYSWWRCKYISISAGTYFYSYIIIPATINHNIVNTITNDCI